MLRGSFIITQKENKGEYNGINSSTTVSTSWYWNNATYDYDIYAHVFDQNGKNGDVSNIPIRYANNSTNYYNTNNIPQCTNDYSITHGEIEYTSTNVSNQYSCNPNLANPGLNAGNWYNFPAATAGSDMHVSYTTSQNSICPKGWRLPPNDDTEKKSYNYLIRNASTYNISTTSSDAEILAAPLSFVRLGVYNHGSGSLNGRGAYGLYWSSTAYSATASRYLDLNSGGLTPQNGYNRAGGFSIRCVSR